MLFYLETFRAPLSEYAQDKNGG